MAIYTQLSPIATPGKPYSFSPKAAAEAAERPEGTFTALSVLALPGPIHTFLAKVSAPEPEPEPTPRPSISVGGGGFAPQLYAERERLARLRRDDNDLLEILSAMLTEGMLN